MRENARALIEKRKEVLEHGLWIVTSTSSTDECAIGMTLQAGRSVDVGFKASAVGFGELAPSGDWYHAGQDSDWVQVKAKKVSVVPKSGVRVQRSYTYPCIYVHTYMCIHICVSYND